MIETNMRKCKVCQRMVVRTLCGKFNVKDKRYIDNNGKQWMGNTCPKCNLIRSRLNMKRKRSTNE